MERLSILSEPNNKFDFFKTNFPHIQNFGEKQLKAFWLWTDINYSTDGKDFDTLSPEIKNALELVIGFFYASDGIVFTNIGENFKKEFGAPEIKFTYSAFEILELIHAKSYGLQLISIITDSKQQDRLMNSITEIEAIKEMAQFSLKYFNQTKYTLLERMIAFLCIEGIFFSSPFAFIFWIRKYYPTKLKGIVSANDLISRDENIHCEFAVHLINRLTKEGYKTEKTIEIFTEAVDLAISFSKIMLPVDLIEMNQTLMISHIKSVANRWLQMINCEILYPSCKSSPFKFIENISLEIKKNFFEHEATEYQKAPEMTINYNPDLSENF
jgi:ribonucleoside-diphosphate reductase beta chain